MHLIKKITRERNHCHPLQRNTQLLSLWKEIYSVKFTLETETSLLFPSSIFRSEKASMLLSTNILGSLYTAVSDQTVAN